MAVPCKIEENIEPHVLLSDLIRQLSFAPFFDLDDQSFALRHHVLVTFDYLTDLGVREIR
ncbi:MAG: hypothetical protein BWY42_01668 [Candidatus Omnitrophica bacterium ADurb.Bin277]|nr:MAG: hypothetical protein BWY42_01668 [Candidatus Omnitrophica bacterium ADurb.Bin277]